MRFIAPVSYANTYTSVGGLIAGLSAYANLSAPYPFVVFPPEPSGFSVISEQFA